MLTAGPSIAFEGSLANLNLALKSLQYEGGVGQLGDHTISLEISEPGVVARTVGTGGDTRYHYYRSVTGSRTWTDARVHARTPVTLGNQSVTGWLVTIGSSEENKFVTQYVKSDAWMGAFDGCSKDLVVGGATTHATPAGCAEGKWFWVPEALDIGGQQFMDTNTKVSAGKFANWAGGEPNNSGVEDAAQFYASRTSGDGATWNDLPHNSTTLSSYIWEYQSTTALINPLTGSFTVAVSQTVAPSAPLSLEATAAIGGATLSWLAPDEAGSFAVLDYRIEYSSNNGVSWTVFNDGVSTNTSATVTGLSPGTTYVFRVRADSAVTGAYSSISESVTIPSVPQAPTIQGITALDRALLVALSLGADGGQPIQNFAYSTDGLTYEAFSPPQTTSPFRIEFQSNDPLARLENGVEYSVSVKAINVVGQSLASTAFSATPVAPPPPAPASPPPVVTQTVAPLAPQPPRLVTLPPQPPVLAPVLQNNQAPQPPVTPQALVNGVPTQVSTLVTDPNNMNIRTGLLNIGINVQNDQGLVRQATNGQTEVQVRSGGVTGFQGTGVAPRSFVQVFMPLQGDNAKELARIPVDETGSFNGEAVFATSLQDSPLPIGRQVLQMVTVDEQGRQTVVEFTVNIVQAPPSPELNREAGETPQLQPGQSLATNAGIPEVVQVTALQDEKQTIIEGDGWVMAVDVNNPNGKVEETEDGGVLLELVRDGETNVSGDGFMPGTRADVWLFSEPTLLGTVEVDENGRFSGSVLIDGQMVAVGEHTLQLQGVGMDGYVRAANLGVVVNDEAALAEATSDAAGGFLWWLLILVLVAVLVVIAYLWWRRQQGQTS